MPSTVTSAPSVPTLYHIPYFCSSIPYNIALELGISKTDLSIKTITDSDLRKGTEILSVSPRRVVPVLQFPSGEVICEVGAIVLHLLETYDKSGKLHPLPGQKNRAKFLQGIVYVVAEGYRAGMDLFMLCCDAGSEGHKMLPKEERDRVKVDEAKKKFIDVVIKHLDREMGDSEFYLGDEVSATDIAFSYLLMCAEYIDEGLLEESDKVNEWYAKMKAREAFVTLFMPC